MKFFLMTNVLFPHYNYVGFLQYYTYFAGIEHAIVPFAAELNQLKLLQKL